MFAPPWFVTFKLTRACNLACAFCRYREGAALSDGAAKERGPVHLDADVALRTLAELHRLGTKRVSLQGDGEPLLYPPLFAVLDAARRLGLKCELITNGTLVNDEAARRLIELGVESVYVSVICATAQSYEALHGARTARHWHAAREGVRALVRRRGGAERPRIVVLYVLSRPNAGEVPAMIEQAAELGADGVMFTPMAVYGEEQRMLSLKPDEEHAALAAIEGRDRKPAGWGRVAVLGEPGACYRAGEAVAARIRCSVGWMTATIRPGGEVVPCVRSDWVTGNLNENSFFEIWRGAAFAEFRRRAVRVGGGTDPLLRNRCSFCCYYPVLRRANRAVGLATLGLRR